MRRENLDIHREEKKSGEERDFWISLKNLEISIPHCVFYEVMVSREWKKISGYISRIKESRIEYLALEYLALEYIEYLAIFMPQRRDLNISKKGKFSRFKNLVSAITSNWHLEILCGIVWRSRKKLSRCPSIIKNSYYLRWHGQ